MVEGKGGEYLGYFLFSSSGVGGVLIEMSFHQRKHNKLYDGVGEKKALADPTL